MSTAKDHQNSSKTELDRLGKNARSEIEAYHGLLKRAGVHLFRAGSHLFQAKSLVREAGVVWADWLKQQQIADSTARQAIDLYRNAKALGHDEIDLEGLTITDAKVKYGVVAPKPKKEKETALPASPPSNDVPPPEGKDDSPTPPPHGKDDTPPPPPPEGKGDSPPPKGKDDPAPPDDRIARSRESVLLDLEEIYGEATEDLTVTLPLKTWKLLDFLHFQEESNHEEIIARAVREYWLRHGDPARVSKTPARARSTVRKHEPELVYSEVTA